MKDKILNIITETIHVFEGKLDINKPLDKQSDIDSLDCAEIELEIQDQFDLNFSFGEVINPDSTPQEVIDNVQKLLDEKRKR